MKQMRVSRSCAVRWLQLHQVEVAQVHAPLGERLVELAPCSGSSSGRIGRMVTAVAVLHRPAARRTASDRGGWPAAADLLRVTSGPCTTTRASSAIRPSGEASSGLMSISLIQRCSTTSWLKRTSSCFERGQVHRLAAAHALQRLVDLGLLHHPARQRGVQRRQRQRAVLEDLDQLSAGAEQQHRAELRIEAAADDQLVAVELRPSAAR